MNDYNKYVFWKSINQIAVTILIGTVMFMLPVIAYLFRREYGFYSSSAVVFIWLLLFVFVFFDCSKARRREK